MSAAPQRNGRGDRLDEVERFYGHLEDHAGRAGFLDPGSPSKLMQRLRRLFARARLEKEEVNILRGILTAAQCAKQAAVKAREPRCRIVD